MAGTLTDTRYDPTASRPYAERQQPLPLAVEEVTAERLTSLLRNRYPGVVVEAIDVVEVMRTHTTKLRLDVALNAAGRAAGIPRHLFLKSNWSGTFVSGDVCVQEAEFYHFLGDRVACRTAQCYYADWDDDGSMQGLIVLEDLARSGGRFGRSADLVGVDGVARAFESLAKLHGSFWNSPELDGFTWLPTAMRAPMDVNKTKLMGWVLNLNLKLPSFRSTVPDYFSANPAMLEQAYQNLIAHEQREGGPRCVILGDCHLGNSYLTPDGDRLWIDWQMARRGRPLQDLIYMMVGGLTPEERRSSDRHLLGFYRERLLATGAENVPSLVNMCDDYRRWAIFGVQVWVSYLDEWGEDAAPLRERFFQACEDLGTWDVLLKD